MGNGFIDKGAKALLKQAFPESEIIEVSGYPNYLAQRKDLTSPINAIRQKLGISIKNQQAQERAINIGELIDADLAVIGGYMLSEFAMKKYAITLYRIKSKGIPLIFLGAGGVYDKKTKKYIKNILKDLGVKVLVTRDSNAYRSYSECCESVYNGIDCAFFINDWYKPPKTGKRFTTATFDKIKAPNLEEKNLIHPHHEPFPKPLKPLIKQFYHSFQSSKLQALDRSFFREENFFFSDELRDYLFLYANTEKTFSDRVHACVPTLAYGNPAKLCYDTPRADLFENVLDNNINKNLVSVSKKKLNRKKHEQISALKEMVESTNVL